MHALETDAAAVRALWDAGLGAQLQQALEGDVFDSELAADDSVASCRSCCGRLNPVCALPCCCWLHPQCWGACRLCFFSHLPECAACRRVTCCDLLARYLKLGAAGRRQANPESAWSWLAACCLAPLDWRINAPGAAGRAVCLSRDAPLCLPGFRVSARGRRVVMTYTGGEGAVPAAGGAAKAVVAGVEAGRPKQG